MINIDNYENILSKYVGKEIITKELVYIFGTEKLKARYKRNRKIGGRDGVLIINKAKKYCIIEKISIGKYLIHSLYKRDNIKVNLRSHPLYKLYYGIKYRCYNNNCPMFSSYGGRGITMCDEWLNEDTGINKFIEWSEANGYKPNKGLSIDRIDNYKGYSPDNCRWVEMKVQIINRRNSNGKIINPKNNKSKLDYIIQNIDEIFLSYLIYKNKTYPVGTFFSECSALDNIEKLYNMLEGIGH
jgi:hypothetical protein